MNIKVGIVINSWKLSIFERHLQQAGYVFENSGHLMSDTLLLRVDTTNTIALGEVLKAANAEAALTREPKL